MTDSLDLLPGIPEEPVRRALAATAGKELASSKFASPVSSSALAVNTFAWFLERPTDLPPLPGLLDLDWPSTAVAVERSLRFPWSGGSHPWLDAVVETPRHMIT